MAEQGDNKDALLEKLENLMRSGRARKRDDPPPLLTDAIPKANESVIPTLTDVVGTPDARPDNHSQATLADAGQTVPADSQNDAPLEFEPASRDDPDKDAPLEFERVLPVDTPQDNVDDLQQEVPTELHEDAPVEIQHSGSDAVQQDMPTASHEFISSRLLAVLDREMTDLSGELPAQQGKLSVLHRSLRFALPELVRLRWEESLADELDDDNDDPSEPEQ